MDTRNPLLQPSNVPVDYDAVTLDNLRAAFDYALSAHQQGIAQALLAQQSMPTWDDLVMAIDDLDAQLLAVLYAASPLMYKGAPWVELVEELYGAMLERFEQKMADPTLQALYERLANSAIGKHLDAHKQATLRWYRHNFALHGALLDAPGRMQLAAINAQVRELAGRFAQNMARPGTLILDAGQLQGLAPRLLGELQAQALQVGQAGWLIPADQYVTNTVLEHAANRSLREQIYRHQHSRGVSAEVQHDNGQLLLQLAQAREQKAHLLGYADYPSLSLHSKSAGGLAQVLRFLHGLAARVKPVMEKHRVHVQALADKNGLDTAQPWDRRYLHRLENPAGQALSMDSLRAYFALDNVIEALLTLAQRLFGLVLVRKSLATWHASVQAYEVWLDNALTGFLYLDVVQYPGKQPGQVETRYIRNRRVDAEGRFHPATVAVFSDIPSTIDGTPPLLDHMALRKLFHEFGHALHHLLVRTNNQVLSNVSALGADGVEVFGKLFERWAWDAGYLAGISANAEAGQLDAQQLAACLDGLRQGAVTDTAETLAMALFDLDLHATPNDGRCVRQRLEDARAQCGYWPLEAYEHPAHAFDYLLDYYDAGYYAYLWSDVLAFDLFSRFQASGLLDRATGRDLQMALLEPGASRPLLEGMHAFLGRAVSHEPFLRWHGLI
ncbi:M3 family metallopeptidase [Pseudomonas sp. SIMBA_065]